MRILRPATALAALLVGLTTGLATGCTPRSADPVPATPASGIVRHDLPPLVKRYPAAGRPVSADWVSAERCPDHNDRSIPGPCDYSLTAIIRLEPAVAQTLRTANRLAPLGGPPGVPTLLEPLLPAGPFEGGADLDESLSTFWPTSAYLHSREPVLVVRSQSF